MKKTLIAITGAPSSGKTTLIDFISLNRQILCQELNFDRFFVYPEAARKIINIRLKNGESLEQIYADGLKLQESICNKNISNIMHAVSNYGISFFDTTLIDDIAFQQYHLGRILPLAKRYAPMCGFEYVFFLESYGDVQDDGVRIEDLSSAQKIGKLQRDTYMSFGYKVIDVPNFGDSENLTQEKLDLIVQKKFDFVLNVLKTNK